MSSRLGSMLLLGLGVATFAAFQGGKYYARNLMQEVGLLVLLLSTLTVAIRLRAHADAEPRISALSWLAWVGIPALVGICVPAFYALVFTIHTGAHPVPSILALRYFGFLLLAPLVALTHRSGIPLWRIERALALSLVLLVVNYSINAWSLDLAAALRSDDRLLASMVVWDEWRGFRLKPNFYAFFLLAFLALASIRGPVGSRGVTLLGGLAAASWLLHLRPRAALLAMIASAVVFSVFLAKARRAGALLVVAPIAAVASLGVIAMSWSDWAHALRADWSFMARLDSFQVAFDVIRSYPLFGYGQRSFYSVTYQDVFGAHFFPGDIGLAGVAFRNGLLGLAAYIAYQCVLVVVLVRTHWQLLRKRGAGSPLLTALTIVVLGLGFVMPLQPALFFEFGFPLGPLALGHAAACRHAVSDRFPIHPTGVAS